MVFLAYASLFIALVFGIFGYGGLMTEPSGLVRSLFFVFSLLFIVLIAARAVQYFSTRHQPPTRPVERP